MALDSSLKIYTNNYKTYENLKDTYTFYEKVTYALVEETKNETETAGTNYRKTYYEQQAIENATSFFMVLLVLYIIIGLLTLITLFRNPDSSKLKLFITFIGLVLFPFLSVGISLLLLKIWKFFMSFLPKNVYLNL
jgi:hypothetical protein